MPSRLREIVRPATPAAAAALLAQTDVTSAPLWTRPRPAAWADFAAERGLDLSQLGLNFITASPAGLRLGAETPLQALAVSPEVQAFAGGLLAEAARTALPLTLRHLVSVGAVLSAQDGPPEVALALLALDAAGEYAAGGQLLLALDLPAGPGVGAALERVARAPRDEAIVAVAARLRLEAGVARGVRVAVAGAGPRRRFSEAEAIVEGQPLMPAVLAAAAQAAEAAAAPAGDFRGGVDYRRMLAGRLTARALQAAGVRCEAPHE